MGTSKSSGKLRKPRRRRLFVYLLDDNVNSFEYVHKVLMAVCNHNTYQAEQCALITHHSGKCLVFSGLGVDPIMVYEHLSKHGLNVELKNKKI